MWKFLKGIFISPPEAPSLPVSDKRSTLVTFRFGKAVTPDEAFYASFSGDIRRMVAALEIETNPIDRHFLLLTIVKEAYKERKQEEMASICEDIATLHLKEFPDLIGPLKEHFGMLPRVPTFQHYATLLTERGDFEKAIQVCEAAISYGLQDGTKSGFEGRIKRIQKAQSHDNGLR